MKDWKSERKWKCSKDFNDDELPNVIRGESKGDCVWRGSRRSVRSSFHRQGAAYRKERLVIFKKDRVGGRARVTIDNERVFWYGWTKIKQKYWGWLVVTAHMQEKGVYQIGLYLIGLFILSQCRDLRTGVTWEDFGLLVTAGIREFWKKKRKTIENCGRL